ncbi:hypothetical protein Y032_0002g642 [Ancylostoma ceylanicum]|uniref:Uncharacterized protein n=1 Tax=Ancylostoma ceylanicum TaxID=53326 RepID=A0A016W2G3_9BILA|nr:hypothetical protein Y032_0002g642 [Ancylostoma ceylanicum]
MLCIYIWQYGVRASIVEIEAAYFTETYNFHVWRIRVIVFFTRLHIKIVRHTDFIQKRRLSFITTIVFTVKTYSIDCKHLFLVMMPTIREKL